MEILAGDHRIRADLIELEGSKFDPVNVMVKACPASGKLGEVLT